LQGSIITSGQENVLFDSTLSVVLGLLILKTCGSYDRLCFHRKLPFHELWHWSHIYAHTTWCTIKGLFLFWD